MFDLNIKLFRPNNAPPNNENPMKFVKKKEKKKRWFFAYYFFCQNTPYKITHFVILIE